MSSARVRGGRSGMFLSLLVAAVGLSLTGLAATAPAQDKPAPDKPAPNKPLATTLGS